MRFRVVFLALLTAAASLAASSDWVSRKWRARWISVAGAPARDAGVYHFRKTFKLPSKPDHFMVHVTGDNRYQLFANGTRVAWGPARGDLNHWRYETVDLAPFLRSGDNLLAAVVWNDGLKAAVAQVTHRTGFLLQGDSDAEQVVNTGADWRGIRDPAYTPLLLPPDQNTGYHALAPTEQVDASRYPWSWEQPGFDDSSWSKVEVAEPAAGRDAQDSPSRWMLVPRPIPPMEETPQRLARVRTATGIPVPAGFPAEARGFTVPAHTRAVLILDQDHLTTAFPELTVSGGRGARVSMRYAEGLWLSDKREKGDRNQVEGKRFLGYEDVFLADGSQGRTYRPLFWRTYRYIQFTVVTQDEAIKIDDLRGTYTGYPFVRKAKLDTGRPEIDRILDVGWRTARLCSHETYMDCPYYEQLQYGGDTRLQGLVSIFMTGDARLLRNAIQLLDSSRTAEGATYSRAPSALQQYIPGFSLWWIGMVHDYWWYTPDPDFVRQMLPGVRSVLAFFESHRRPSGLLGALPWWPYVDWTPQWSGGVPPQGPDGENALHDLQLLLAYQWASELEKAQGNPALAVDDQSRAMVLKAVIRERYWDAAKGLYTDNTAHREFSQQTNALAVMAGVSQGAEARQVMEHALSDTTLVQASTYFRAYLHEAMRQAGLGDRYLDMLDPWRTMLAMNLTTWAEALSFDRSDCHAWGSSPNFDLFRIVLGLDSAAPGFSKIVLRPNLGPLTRISGTVPHPKGEIRVDLEVRNGERKYKVQLPAGVTGEIHWGPVNATLPE